MPPNPSRRREDDGVKDPFGQRRSGDVLGLVVLVLLGMAILFVVSMLAFDS